MAAARRELDLFKAREQATNERLAELTGLQENVAELRRRERLAAALQELGGQRQVIEQRLIVLRRLTQDQENTIGAGAGEVITLAEDRRALLAAGVRDALARAGETTELLAAEEERLRTEEGRLAEVRQHLEAAQQRQADLAAERDGQLEQLAAHAGRCRARRRAVVGRPGTGTRWCGCGQLWIASSASSTVWTARCGTAYWPGKTTTTGRTPRLAGPPASPAATQVRAVTAVHRERPRAGTW